ncbi:TPA: hypothetical protein ON570_004196 [Citrobacter werkmanii]|nr:hypothetical protein [Citrobacter werkmanii]
MQNVVIYSACQVMTSALDALCRAGRKNDVNIIYIHESDKLTGEIICGQTQCIILDIEAHRHAYWLYRLRLSFPNIPFIVTQRRILFSDRVLAEYLGITWLRDYDAILAAWPVFRLTDVIRHEIFSGPGAGVTLTEGDLIMTPKCFHYKINQWLSQRLDDVFSEYPSVIMIIDGFLKGLSVKNIGKKMSISNQMVYEYRKVIMRTLNIQHYHREFFRSLKFQNMDV